MTIKVLVEVGLAKGVVEAAGFPTAAEIDVYGAWNATAHNIGDTGVFGLGIVNTGGNPGNIVIKVNEEETVISQDQYLRYYYVDAKPYCTRISMSGAIKFTSIGSYTIKVWGMHLDAGVWYYDDEKIFKVTVTTEPPPEPTFWEKLKKYADENPLSVVVGVGAVLGGAILYRKSEK